MDRNEKLLNKIITGSFIAGIMLAAFGLYLAFLGGDSETIVELLGQKVTSKNAGVVSIFIGAVLIISLIRRVLDIVSQSEQVQDNLLALYRQFEKSKKSPHENAALIEQIANAKNPNKKDYLMQASGIESLSIMEGDAINMALADIKENKVVANLLERCREKEWANIQKMVQKTDDPLYKPLVSAFKYSRYVCRKDSPSFNKLNQFLSESLAHGHFTEKAMQLSKELEAELKSVSL
jgi:hypothetical protein